MKRKVYIKAYESPLGRISIASEEDHIIGLWFDGQKYDRSSLKGCEIFEEETPVLREATSWLDVYFSGKDPGPCPPTRVDGSDFRKSVLEILCDIPYGQTMTYGAIAAKMAKRLGKDHMSAQAVGGAVGHNPISILIPCHRVMGAKGSLTGYAGGIERKRSLLELEGAIEREDQ